MEEVGNIRKKLECLFQAIDGLKDVGVKNLITWPHGDDLGIMKFEITVECKAKVRNMADQWTEALLSGVRLWGAAWYLPRVDHVPLL